MRVLLCTPYLQCPNVVSGGINVWGNNIWQYYQHLSNQELQLDIVSYDRVFNVQEDSTIIQRAYYGIKDYAKAIKETIILLSDNNYDVLHLCTSAQLGLIKDYLVIKEAHKRGVKVALHLHFGRVSSLFEKGGIEFRLLKRVLKATDSIIAIDPDSYNTLLHNGFKNTYYLPNPLSLEIVRQIVKEENSNKRLANRILYVGHVIPSKGIYELVEACKDIDGIELHYVGSVAEEDRAKLMAFAQGEREGSWFVLHGPIDHNEVLREMLTCDIFVLPSYTEGFPNVILEAMACGCAIIATKVGAIPEMLEEENHNQYGILVNPKDIDDLKNAIIFMLNNDKVKASCRNNVKKRVNQKYAIPIVWDRLTQIWTSVK